MAQVKFTFEGESSVLLALLGLAKLEDDETDGEGELGSLSSGILAFPPSAPPLAEAPSPTPKGASPTANAALQSLVQAAQQRAKAEWEQQGKHFGTTSTLPNAMVPDTTGLDQITPAVPSAAPSAVTSDERFTKFDFGSLPLKEEAWAEFQTFIDAWMVNFNGPVDENHKPILPQPDRLEMLRVMGSCRWTVFILRWIAHYKCLQGAVRVALKTDDLDLVDKVSTTIVQVSHMAFPDIAGFYDDSTRWRRA
jgi:hypothetical protein